LDTGEQQNRLGHIVGFSGLSYCSDCWAEPFFGDSSMMGVIFVLSRTLCTSMPSLFDYAICIILDFSEFGALIDTLWLLSCYNAY
jgi:hypothetical protein